MKIKKSQAEAFVKEIQALTEKYGIVIAGCGCCDSPRLEHIDDYENSSASKELEFEDGHYILNRLASQYAKEEE